MGGKIPARERMRAAGVPVVPGGLEAIREFEEARAAAAALGYPVLVKASAGGGGRGMRRVEDEAGLAAALERARSEAKASFGDDTIYLEKYLSGPRHIEIQVLADPHGKTLHLGERECSIQRRHQKLVEEAPAYGMTEAVRAAMGDAAVRAAKAVGYVGAGTCEFMMDSTGAFYFLEMNTRIQVEHPVTEAVTGLDLVALQIRIAAGEAIPFEQADVRLSGHAIEARIYAEDPDAGFVPSPGPILAWQAPEGPGIRLDAGFDAGMTVTPHYDAMLAKLIAQGRDRAEALERSPRRSSSSGSPASRRGSRSCAGWSRRRPSARAPTTRASSRPRWPRRARASPRRACSIVPDAGDGARAGGLAKLKDRCGGLGRRARR